MNSRAELTLHIPGGAGHFISLEVLFQHLKQALKATSVDAGEYVIIVDRDGCVFVNGENMFTPKSMLMKDGAA